MRTCPSTTGVTSATAGRGRSSRACQTGESTGTTRWMGTWQRPPAVGGIQDAGVRVGVPDQHPGHPAGSLPARPPCAGPGRPHSWCGSAPDRSCRTERSVRAILEPPPQQGRRFGAQGRQSTRSSDRRRRPARPPQASSHGQDRQPDLQDATREVGQDGPQLRWETPPGPDPAGQEKPWQEGGSVAGRRPRRTDTVAAPRARPSGRVVQAVDPGIQP